MTDKIYVEEEEVGGSEIVMGPGRRLRLVRESKNVTVEMVASELHVMKRCILDLEDDRYDRIEYETYARGYLKLYAKMLELPVDEIMEAFEAISKNCFVTSRRPVQKRKTKKPPIFTHVRRRGFHWLTYGIVSLLVVLVLLWWHDQRELGTHKVVTESAQIGEALVNKPVTLSNTAETPTKTNETVSLSNANVDSDGSVRLSQKTLKDASL